MQINTDMIYPIGSIYISMNSTNPHDLFGGTWQQISGRFLWGTINTPGSTGGEATHTLTIQEMPTHHHAIALQADEGDRYNGILFGLTGKDNQAFISDMGGTQPHNNMPPYLDVYMWKRIA